MIIKPYSWFIVILISLWCKETMCLVSQEDIDTVPCGQYGFRCIDERFFQVCSYTDSDGQTEQPDVIHECQDKNVCDEDNPAFCVPASYVTDSKIGKSIEKQTNGRAATRQIKAVPTKHSKKHSEPIEIDAFPNSCENYGVYADETNNTMFWFCDHDLHLRHMFCTTYRIFDPITNDCIFLEDAQSRNVADKHQAPEKSEIFQLDGDTFTCDGKSIGKYADVQNCRLYHFCLSPLFAPLNELLFSCPNGQAYDSSYAECTVGAAQGCLQINWSETLKIAEQLTKTICENEIRFCGNQKCVDYYVCNGNHIVHMRCPGGQEFHESIMMCK